MKKLVAFDLDGTLAESKSAMDDEAAGLFAALLGVVRVAIISGGDWPQFQKQVLARLPAGADLDRLSLLPTCGTRFMHYTDGTWTKLYSEDLTADEKATIETALAKAVVDCGFAIEKPWGPTIEDRGSQITYSALGQEAPLEPKKSWDPDQKKRLKIIDAVENELSAFSVRLGGSTSIDVTKPGIDKAYGMRKLAEVVGFPTSDMIFVGDALYPGGNDAPARETDAACIQVRDPEETKRVIEAIVATFG